MQTTNLAKVAKNLGGIISKNSPTILTGVAVGGLITTVILAVRATPKALRILDEEKDDYIDKLVEEGRVKDFNSWDIIQLTWKCYIPAAAVGTATIACIIGANSISLRRNAALASVYSITEAAFKEYQAKVTETLGKNKEEKIRDEIAKERITNNPPGKAEIIFTGKGEVLCYDSYTGRYFKGDIETIRKIENELNRRLRDEMFIGLNELYYELGLAPTKLGNEMGWDMDHGYLEFKFSSQLTDEEQPCLVVDYEVYPRFSYGQ